MYIGGKNKINIIQDVYGSFEYPSNEYKFIQLNYWKVSYQEPTGRKQIICRSLKKVNKVLSDLGSSYRLE
jgi:hypothetical protein